MITRATRRMLTVAAAASVSALVLAGCTSSPAEPGNSTDPQSPEEQLTLSIATFNDFGYSEELLAEYTKDHPNITITHNRAAESGDARANFFQKLGSGGLADIEAVEIDWFAEMMQYADLLAPVDDSLKGRWLDWKEAAATDANGNLVAYGTDIGPQGICYRADLFEAAGLPTDRDEVAALFPTWDAFFQVGADYVAKTGTPFIDSANSVLQGLVNQVEFTYEQPDGTIIAETNPVVREAYDTVVEKAIPIAAFSGQWSEDWFASMANGEYAAMLCPPWMHGIISGTAPDITGWDVADAFPGGGGNWGGSYLVIPANGKNVEAAKELAAWLTSPEVQLKAFVNVGTFPSQIEAQASSDLSGFTNPYYNNAPTGQIGIDRANAITVAPYKGPKYFQYHDALQDAVNRVFDGLEDQETAWNSWLTQIAGF